MFENLPTYDEVKKLRRSGKLFQWTDADNVTLSAGVFSKPRRMLDPFHTPTLRCHARQESTGRATDLKHSPGRHWWNLSAIRIENLFCRKFPKSISAIVWEMCALMRTIVLGIIEAYRPRARTRIRTH
jgi:hypothetical protein